MDIEIENGARILAPLRSWQQQASESHPYCVIVR